MSSIGDKVVAACEKHWPQYKDDCSGFVKAVARDLNITVTGQANNIVDQLEKSPWQELNGGSAAAAKADAAFVVAGLKAQEHGHVVVVVPGNLAQGKYPTAYWGRLGGIGKKNMTLNWAWDKTDRDKVVYAWRAIP